MGKKYEEFLFLLLNSDFSNEKKILIGLFFLQVRKYDNFK